MTPTNISACLSTGVLCRYSLHERGWRRTRVHRHAAAAARTDCFPRRGGGILPVLLLRPALVWEPEHAPTDAHVVQAAAVPEHSLRTRVLRGAPTGQARV